MISKFKQVRKPKKERRERGKMIRRIERRRKNVEKGREVKGNE